MTSKISVLPGTIPDHYEFVRFGEVERRGEYQMTFPNKRPDSWVADSYIGAKGLIVKLKDGVIPSDEIVLSENENIKYNYHTPELTED